jgi:hypothetical protein
VKHGGGHGKDGKTLAEFVWLRGRVSGTEHLDFATLFQSFEIFCMTNPLQAFFVKACSIAGKRGHS